MEEFAERTFRPRPKDAKASLLQAGLSPKSRAKQGLDMLLWKTQMGDLFSQESSKAAALLHRIVAIFV